MNWWIDFYTQLRQTHPLEYIAVGFGIISVLFARKADILVYPTGLINTILYTWFCFKWWGLYAEGSLNFYYTLMSLYGWYNWTKHKNKAPLPITQNSKPENLKVFFIFLGTWLILYLVLHFFTKSNVAMIDALASACAYIGMWQMAKKKVENWCWWMATNIISIPLYFYKNSVASSFQYLIFLIIAIAGWQTWKKQLKTPSTTVLNN